MRFIKFYIPLFGKFVIAIVFIVALFGSVNAYLIWTDVQRALEKESEKRALFIGKSLSNQMINPILFEDYVAIQKLADETVELDSSIEYVFLIDENGDIVIHSFEFEIPIELSYANIPGKTDKIKILLIKPIRQEGNLIRDIAIPILEGRLGTLRVGISEESISSDIMVTINHFWLMVFFFLLTGIVGAFIIAYFITNPIKQIQTVADKLDFKSLRSGEIRKVKIRRKYLKKWKLLFRAEDEIDKLAERFNYMLIRLKEAYSKLEKTQHKLIQSEKLATIGTISSGIAHEINNPIAGIKNCLRRIENDPDNKSQNRNYLKMMSEAVDRIENVVITMLNFTRKQDFEFEKIDIEMMLERVLLFLGYRLEKKRISIVKNIEPNISSVMGSPTHIEQVILNLIINSIDAIEEKENQLNNKITIDISSNSKYITTSITDNGVGISTDELSKIFDPFYTTKPPGKGTGLGLAVISNIMEAHEGKIEVKSESGIGSTFNVFLPSYKKS